MGVTTACVLGEVLRMTEFADVVEIRADTGEQRIGPYRLGSLLGERRHHETVVVGAGRLHLQAFEQRMVEVAEFKQTDVRRDAKDELKQRQQTGSDRRNDEAVQ